MVNTWKNVTRPPHIFSLKEEGEKEAKIQKQTNKQAKQKKIQKIK